MAGLMLRVGRCDEPLPLRGITHLLEHLVTHAVYADGDEDVDGTVYEQRTTFEWEGERDVVLRRLSALAAALADPAPARIDAEVRVLRIEGDEPHHRARLLRERFGAAGFGTAGWRQYGLDWVGVDQLRDWVREFATLGNAGIWMTGEPPAELELPLAPGPRRPPPPPEAIPGLRLPAQRHLYDDNVAVSVVARRSVALRCGVEIAAQRAHALLRYGLGLTYCVDDDYTRLDAGTAQASLDAGCLETDAARVRAGLLAALEAVASAGPTDAELERVRTNWLEEFDEPGAEGLVPGGRLLDELLGAPASDRRLEVASVTPDAVADALGAALGSCLVLGPASLSAPEGFQAYDDLPDQPVAGSIYASSDGSDERIVLAPDGVSWLGDGDPYTIRFAETCGAVRTEEGGLELVQRDGHWCEIDESDWVGGGELLAALERGVPPEALMPPRAR